MTTNGYALVAEDFIAMATEQPGGFDVLLCYRLIWRSKELPTAATSDQLMTEVLSEWVQAEWSAFEAYRRRVRNAPVWGMLIREVPSIVEALKPLCVQIFPTLNVVLSVDRDALFHPRNYITTAGRLYYEEAPSVTFTRYLNDMERLKAIKSETYEREVSRLAEVHALNRVANIMPRAFHRGFDGMLQPEETVEQVVQRERAQVWRNAFGGMTMGDLLAEAGMA